MIKILKLILVSSFIALVAISTNVEAATPLFGAVGLDTSFCKEKAIRQTVVYIDDTMMVDGKTEWAKKINTKLKATLVPGEMVTVVKLSPGLGQSTEIWSACWPNYSAAKKAELEKEKYFFSQNPMEGITQQQAFFIRDFGSALTAVYMAGKRDAAEVKVNLKAPPKKSILRALASDESRFSTSSVPIRAIIYSDMLENSDLGSVYTALPNPFPNYAEKLGSKFKKGIFYAFGVAEDMDDGQTAPESIKGFWTETFRGMSAVISGFGSDLNVPNSAPTQSYTYKLNYAFNGQDLDGKMSLLTDAEGNLVDSWLGFSRLSISGINGTFQCQNDTCKLDATTTSLATNSPSESLTLSGKTAKMSGKLGVPGTQMIFDLKAELLNN